LIRQAGLPEPEVNTRIGRWEVDFLWREQRFVVEVDGYASHSSPWAFERDRTKTAELQAASFAVLRITAKSLKNKPDAAVESIASALHSAPGAVTTRRRRGG
jgi:very-short-patch-repair endonuclease